MRFLADQDVYATTVRFLAGLGHDVVTANQLGMAQAADLTILLQAEQQQRLLLTRDRDYGNLVFAKGAGCGVVYLRMLPSTQDLVHAELEHVLTVHEESALRQAFVVVEPGRHRIRHAVP